MNARNKLLTAEELTALRTRSLKHAQAAPQIPYMAISDQGPTKLARNCSMYHDRQKACQSCDCRDCPITRAKAQAKEAQCNKGLVRLIASLASWCPLGKWPKVMAVIDE